MIKRTKDTVICDRCLKTCPTNRYFRFEITGRDCIIVNGGETREGEFCSDNCLIEHLQWAQSNRETTS